MIRMTAALLTLGVVAATASPAFAQGYGECFVAGSYCNPDAPYCRSMCWPRPQPLTANGKLLTPAPTLGSDLSIDTQGTTNANIRAGDGIRQPLQSAFAAARVDGVNSQTVPARHFVIAVGFCTGMDQ
jgi:hypothetical protein